MLWAFATVITNIIEQLIIRHTLEELNLILFAFLFYLFGTIFTFLYHFRKTTNAQKFDSNALKYNMPNLIGYAGGAFIGNALWFMSVVAIGLGMTAFILIFIRIIVTSYSYLFMNDKISPQKMIALCVGFMALLVFSFTGQGVPLWGICLAFLSCFGFAAETIFRKKLVMENANPENMLLIRQASSFLLWAVILLFSIFVMDSGLGETLQTISLQTLGIVLFLSFLGGMFLHLLAFQAMKTVDLSLYEALNAVKPVVISLVGMLFLNEVMTTMQIMSGGIVILSSLYFIKPTIPSKKNVP